MNTGDQHQRDPIGAHPSHHDTTATSFCLCRYCLNCVEEPLDDEDKREWESREILHGDDGGVLHPLFNCSAGHFVLRDKWDLPHFPIKVRCPDLKPVVGYVSRKKRTRRRKALGKLADFHNALDVCKPDEIEALLKVADGRTIYIPRSGEKAPRPRKKDHLANLRIPQEIKDAIAARHPGKLIYIPTLGAVYSQMHRGIIRAIHCAHGVSVRKLARITGKPRRTIQRIIRKGEENEKD